MKSDTCYREHGWNCDVQNLDWSQEMSESASEVNLCDKTVEKIDAKDLLAQGGPLHFIVMAKLKALTTEAASESTIAMIKEFKIKEQGGEDICTVVSVLRADKVPHDSVH